MTFWSLRLPQSAEGGSWWMGVREYFAYHGVWAPGVRLLRRMPVRQKLILVTGIAAAPLLPLAWQSIQAQNELVANTHEQLIELRLAGAIASMSAAVNATAITADAGGMPAGDSLPAGLAQLQQAFAVADAADLPLRQDWERNRQGIENAVQHRAASAEGRMETSRAAGQALAHLRKAVSRLNLAHAVSDSGLASQGRLAVEQLPNLQLAIADLNWQVGRAAPAELHGGERYAMQIRVAGRMEQLRSLTESAEGRLAAAGQGSGQAGAEREVRLVAVRAYLDAINTLALAYDGNPTGNAPLRSGYEAARAELARLQQDTYAQAESGLLHQQDVAQGHRLWVIGTLLGAIALASYLLYCFYLVMRGGLNQLNHQMQRMAEGDLSARPLPVGGDEVAATMQAMNTSLVRLSDLMAAVRVGVGGVNQASSQVAAGNIDLTARNRETAGSVASVVEGVTRYSAQLQACGRQVEAVVQTVQELRLESARNRKQMARLRERMTALRSKSREIGEIVTLIDAIAFRTNILALNASVEAGKAGELGRGFAVVAQEVRTLALRGSESARRIGDIVMRSTDDIELSGALAEETGLALAKADEHVDSIRVAADDVAVLTRSGEKESAEILRQLTHIHDGTTKSLGLVEQLANASTALRAQGERLAHKVGQFRLS